MRDCRFLCFVFLLLHGSDGKEFLVSTPQYNGYAIYPIESQLIFFKVEASEEACIAFFVEQKVSDPTYQVCLGVEKNEHTLITYGIQETEAVKTVSKGILSEDELRSFWVSVDDNKISYGRGGESCPSLYWIDTQSPMIQDMQYLGLRTKSCPGTWEITDDPDAELPPVVGISDPYDDFTKIPQTIETTGNYDDFVWFKWSHTGVNFEVKADRDAQLMVSTQRSVVEPYNRVTLGGTVESMNCPNCQDNSTGDKIELTTYMVQPGMISKEKFVAFWMRWGNGGVAMGYRGDPCPFLAWKDKRDFKGAALGIRTIGVPGSWVIQVPMIEIKTTSSTLLTRIETTTKYNPNFVIPENTEEIVVETDPNDKVKYFPAHGTDSFYFKVRGKSTVTIRIAQDQNDQSDNYYQVVIGDHCNSISFIRKNNFKPDPAVQADTSSILSNSEMRGFRIQFSNGSITVSRANQGVPFLSWCDPHPFPVNEIGVSTGSFDGFWILYVPKPNARIPPSDIKETERPQIQKLYYQVAATTAKPDPHTLDLITNKTDTFKSMKWSGSYLIFKVRTHSDAHISLSESENDKRNYRVYIGGWGNKRTTIHKNSGKDYEVSASTDSILSRDEYRSFWIHWNGAVTMGRMDESCPIISYCDPNPIKVKFVGFRTSRDPEGHWKIRVPSSHKTTEVEVQTAAPPHSITTLTNYTLTIQTPRSNKFKYFGWSASIIRFKVKASRDAHVALSSLPNDNAPQYRIFIGGWNNTKTAIEKLSGFLQPPVYTVTAPTPKILSEIEPREFWITWSNRIVQIGKEGETCPLLSLCDPLPIKVTYVGLKTAWVSSGTWELQGVPAENKILKLSASVTQNTKGPEVVIY